MLENPSLMTRIVIGKTIGFVIGLAGMLSLPYFYPDAGWLLRWGVLFWYTTVGAVIAIFGAVTWNPVLKLPLRWWFRDPLIGAWLNFVLTLFAYADFEAMLVGTFGPDGALSSPFWFVLEGAVVGLVIGFFATRFGGEGTAAVDAMNR